MKSIAAFLLITAVVVLSGCTSGPSKDYSAFTSCISSFGIQEYGAYWCPNCARVKLTLGDAWKNLNYVECDPKCVTDAAGKLPDFCNGFASQTEQCLALGVDKYPTWIKGDEILYAGTDLQKIADISGCQLP